MNASPSCASGSPARGKYDILSSLASVSFCRLTTSSSTLERDCAYSRF